MAGKVQDVDKQVDPFHTFPTNGGCRTPRWLGNLRGHASKNETYWYAQGIEIDYAAQGNSVEEVKERFGSGLYATNSKQTALYGNSPRTVSGWYEHAFIGDRRPTGVEIF